MSNLLQRTAAELNGAGPTVSRETHVHWLPLHQVHDNPYQPRQHYDAEHILNLALSIKALKKELPATKGLQQMPLARLGNLSPDGSFDAAPRLLYSQPVELRQLLADPSAAVQLMFGHSRLRAFRVLASGLAQFDPTLLINKLGSKPPTPSELGIDIDLKGLDDWQTTYADLMQPDQDYDRIPVVMGFALDFDMWRHAITENSQRKNINPIEEAATMARAQDEFGLTDEQAGAPFGYARSTTANKMRLLKLPAEVQRDIAAGKLTERHGRELLRLADDPAQLAEVHKDTIKQGKTVAQLSEDVGWRAKRLQEAAEKVKELEAARAILDAGWTPPGSTIPLSADRVSVASGYPSFFTGADGKKLLRAGICGSHCDCCLLSYRAYSPDDLVRPDAERAPHIGLACDGDYEVRQAKRAALEALKRQGQIEPSEAERLVAEDRAQRKAKVEELKRQGRERWDKAIGKLDKAALWQDVRFWRVMFDGYSYGWQEMAKRAQSVMELQQMILERLYDNARSYDRDLSENVPDMAKVERIITALTQPLEKPGTLWVQPGPGDSQQTDWREGWDEADEATYQVWTAPRGRPDDWEEILVTLSEIEADITPQRPILRLIEECDDKAVRGQFWRRYNELTGVSRETRGEA